MFRLCLRKCSGDVDELVKVDWKQRVSLDAKWGQSEKCLNIDGQKSKIQSIKSNANRYHSLQRVDRHVIAATPPAVGTV